MTDSSDGLGCGHAHDARLLAEDERITRDDAATSNVTDLRRARQKARGVVRGIVDAIQAYLATRGISSMLSSPAGARQANRAITELASERFRDELVNWLVQRNKTTMGRSARDAFDKMTQGDRFPDDDELTGVPQYDGNLDREVLRQIRQIDAGLLYDTELAEQYGLDEPLAEKLGDRITRTLRQGVAQDASPDELARRVEYVLTDGQADGRQESGVSGQTIQSKAELIAHDSVQDAYNQAARGRYLRNGFRYGVYDAVVDTVTTDICLRMNEHVIDLRDDPYLVPPLHPYCRSGIRPILDLGDRSVLSRDDIADGFLSTIMSTKSYRPPANVAGQFRPTSLTRERGQV